jgi:ribosomal protein S18 acetylase RimI-like enzyme
VKGIRLSRPEDLGALKDIWNASFPGDEAFADWFLKTTTAPERALVWEDGGLVRAMLHLLPMRCRAGGLEMSATYVYAVATLPECRGRGVAAALLTEAEEMERARGTSLIMLVPQSKSLFEYYRRQGYQDALFHARRVIRAGREIPTGLELNDSPEVGELNACFEAALHGRDRVARTAAHWARSLSYLRALGIRRDGCLVGYAVYEPEGVVRELVALDEDARAALEAGVLMRLNALEAVAFCPDGPGEPYGMARAIVPGVEIRNGYAGLMLD